MVFLDESSLDGIIKLSVVVLRESVRRGFRDGMAISLRIFSAKRSKRILGQPSGEMNSREDLHAHGNKPVKSKRLMI